MELEVVGISRWQRGPHGTLLKNDFLQACDTRLKKLQLFSVRNFVCQPNIRQVYDLTIIEEWEFEKVKTTKWTALLLDTYK